MDRLEMLARALRRELPGLEVRENEPMRNHTTFRIGGPARLMALPRSEEEAQSAVRLAADAGVEAFLIKSFDGLGRLELAGEAGIRAGSGVLLSRLANFALANGLTGLEFAHGIPGTLGGAAAMNAGAYGGEMAQVLTRVTYLDEGGAPVTLPVERCGLSYRHSVFSDHPQWLILEAELALAPGQAEQIRGRMAELAQRRREKQPLEQPSAGSTFKRPEGHFAAALIEGCGLKGVGIGGAQVSEKHAGFVVNRGGATADDVRRLMALVQETVLRETGVALEPEVRLLGF